MSAADLSRQRLDKWLWHARIVKTRTLAQKLVEGGSVRINSMRNQKPDAHVGPGDVLTIGMNNRVIALRILGVAERRGTAPSALLLYEILN